MGVGRKHFWRGFWSKSILHNTYTHGMKGVETVLGNKVLMPSHRLILIN